jgi:hypothetical protein
MAKYLDYEGLKKLITKLGGFITSQVTSQIENQSPQVYAISEDEVNDLFPNLDSTETIRYQAPDLDSYYYSGYSEMEICAHHFSVPITTTSKIQITSATGTSLGEIDCSALTWTPTTDWNSSDTSGKYFATAEIAGTSDTYGEWSLWLCIGGKWDQPNNIVDIEVSDSYFTGDNSIVINFQTQSDNITTQEQYISLLHEYYPLSVTVTNL